MTMRKGLIRSIMEAVGERERVEDEPAPTVDELVAFPPENVDDPSELLGVSYGDPEDVAAEEGGEEEITEVSKAELDAQAKLVHGGFSQTSKMPCKSFSLPPGATCPAGSKQLKKDPYTVCAACYAKVGHEAMPRSKEAKGRRLGLLQKALKSKTERDKWVAEMISSIERQGRYFRWHDAGDIFKPAYLDLIIDIVRGTPDTQHWIPTKQEDFVKDWVRKHGAGELPRNVCVRISAMRINEEKRQPSPFTASSVYISEPPPRSFPCSATWDAKHIQRYGRRTKSTTKSGEVKLGIAPTCGPCRACWDRGVPQVCYRFHGYESRLPSDLQKEVRGRQDVIGPILRRLRSEG